METAGGVRKTVRVVAAVIRDQGRIFATERGYGDWKDYWEFPGGKIEPGETPEEALRREIREELATEISVGQKLCTVEYDYPAFHLSMDCFLCGIIEGKLTLLEAEDSAWLDANSPDSPDSLDSVRWLPADLQVVQALKEAGVLSAGSAD